MNFFKNIKLDNVHIDTVTYLYDPPASWANPTDCG